MTSVEVFQSCCFILFFSLVLNLNAVSVEHDIDGKYFERASLKKMAKEISEMIVGKGGSVRVRVGEKWLSNAKQISRPSSCFAFGANLLQSPTLKLPMSPGPLNEDGL